jgi:transcriptional regulator with XRE-family HTH domain
MQGKIMSSYLQEQIKERMGAKNLTIYALEKKAGLNRSAVRNILQGFSKKPSADILKSIATVLECTLDDLVGSNEVSSEVLKSTSRTPTNIRETHMWKETLFFDAVKTISHLIAEKSLVLKLDQVTGLINEAYKYSISKNSDHVDQDFCKWLVNKSF